MYVPIKEDEEKFLLFWKQTCSAIISLVGVAYRRQLAIMPRGKDAAYFSSICAHFESNKRSKEYVAHQSKVSRTSLRSRYEESS